MGTHRRRKRTTTTDDYAAMLRRMITAYGTRIGEDPAAGLGHLREIEQALTDAQNLGLYTANQAGHSINRLADLLHISKQAVHKRIGLGELVARRRRERPQQISTAAKVAAPREITR